MAEYIVPINSFLLRAVYDYILVNGGRPHIGVAVDSLPPAFSGDINETGSVLLNICPRASNDLVISDDGIAVGVRKGGVPHFLNIPLHHVYFIVDPNCPDMSFTPMAPITIDDEGIIEVTSVEKPRPKLTVVK